MNSYNPFSPVEIQVVERNTGLARLEELVHGLDHLLILASSRMIKKLDIGNWLKQLEENVKCTRIEAIPPNPSVKDVCGLLEVLRGEEFDAIICIGGGSCIDLGKAVSALHNLALLETPTVDFVRDAIKSKSYIGTTGFTDIIAVPTTSGTGSEVTKWATIWDMEKLEKLSIDCQQLFPKAAILIPEFTVTMPARLTLSTGLDALSHAMEAFWAKARTPLSQALALAAIEHVRDNLAAVIDAPSNLQAREGMCIGSLLAGLAFSITRTTACHSISYPLTMGFGVEHGFAVAITLKAVAEKNAVQVPEILRIWDIFGGEDRFNIWLDSVSLPIQRLKLSSFGVEFEQICTIISQALTQGRIDNNPIAFTQGDIKDILLRCM